MAPLTEQNGMSRSYSRRRQQRLILALSLFLLLAMATEAMAEPAVRNQRQEIPDQATPGTDSRPSKNRNGTNDGDGTNSAATSDIHFAPVQGSGSACPGSEGQWNCMTTSWQRCAAGQWSVVMQCSLGTMCTPAGLTNDFHIEYAPGYGGTPGGSSSGAPGGSSGTGGGGVNGCGQHLWNCKALWSVVSSGTVLAVLGFV
jgi:hypothetical protein